MGNTKSKGSQFHGHEKLEEHNPRYFAKVQARNTTSDVRSRWRCRKRHHKPSTPITTKSEDGSDQIDIQSHVGILEANERINGEANKLNQAPSPVFQLSSTATKEPKHAKLGPSKPIIKLPSPREGPSRLLETASSVSSSSTARVKDYYTDMMEEASKESRDDSVRMRDVMRNFDAMLPSGVVWAEITRGAKVTCLALSSQTGGNTPLLLAIGAEDGTVGVVEIYNTASSPRSVVSRGFKKHGPVRELMREGKIRSLDFSPDGKWLAAGGDDCTACLVRLQFRRSVDKPPTLNGLQVVTEIEREDRVYAVRFSPNGFLLAIGGFDDMVAIASVKDGNKGPQLELVTEILRSGLVLSLDWSPDGMLLAIADSDKCCGIVDDSWEITGEIQRPTSIQTVKWSPDGSFLAVGCKDGAVSIVDIASHDIASEVVRGQDKIASQDGVVDSPLTWSSAGYQCQVNSLCWSADGAFLAIGGSDAACAVVECQSFTVVQEFHRIGPINCVDWEQKVLAVGGDDRTVALLKTGGGEDTEVSSVSDCSFDDISSAASSTAYSLGLSPLKDWVMKEDFRDVDESSVQHTNPDISIDEPDSNVAITAVAFSRAKTGTPSSFMVMASSTGRVTVLSANDWSNVTKLKFSHPIRAMHFSRKNKFLALGGDDSVAYIVLVSEWRVVRETRVTAPIRALGFCRTDESLAVGTSDGLVALLGRKGGWDVIGEMDERDAAVQTLDWSRDNLAIGRADGSVTIHEAEKVHSNFFVPQAEFSRGSNPVGSVAFSAKGKYLAVGGSDMKISIYSAKGGWVLCHQVKVTNRISKLSWSSTGRYLGYCGEGNNRGATIIDTLSWSEVDELRTLGSQKRGIGIGEVLSCLAWSGNDKWVAFAGSSGAAHVIDTESWTLAHALKHTGQVPEQDSPERSATQVSESPASKKQFFADPPEVSPTKTTGGDDVAWAERLIVAQFLEVSSIFLAPYEDANPPASLRVYVICILMLDCHVSWISETDHTITNEITKLDDGEPLHALLGILKTAVEVMNLVLENQDAVEEWWESSATSFDLKPKDLRRVHAWNEQWRLVDASVPIVDTNLLMTINQLKINPIGSE